MKKVNGYFDSLEVPVDDVNLYVSGQCTGYVEDCGIGSYEYWGAPSYDSDLRMVIDDWMFTDIEMDVVLENDKVITMSFTPEQFQSEYSELWDKLEYNFPMIDEGIDWDDYSDDE